MHVVESERLLVQHGQLVRTLVLPASDVGEMLVVALRFAVGELVLQAEVRTAGFLTRQSIVTKQRRKVEECRHAPSFLKLHVDTLRAAHNLDIVPELIADGRQFLDGIHERLLRAPHADILPDELAEFAVNLVRCLGAFDVHHLLDARLHSLLGLLELGRSRGHTAGLLGGEVSREGGGNDEVAIRETLHESGSAEAVRSVVGEVRLAEHVQTRDGGHEVVVHPETAHGVVRSGVNHHRLLVGIHIGDLLVHFEEVAVLAVDPLLAHAGDGVLEVEEHAATGGSYAAAVVAGFLGGAGGDIARSEVAEGGIFALQIVIALALRHVGCLHFAVANFLRYFFALWYPDATIIAQGFGHESQLALVVALHGDAGGVDLREAGIGEVGAFLPAGAGSAHVAAHCIGGEEKHAPVAAGSQQHGVARVALDFACHEIAHHDTLRMTIHHHEIHHLRARVHLDVSLADLLLHGLVAAKQKLLPGLTAAVECALQLGSSERAVVQETAVFTSERHTLCYALVDDVAGNLGEAVYIGLSGAEIATLHRIVEKAVDGVTIVLVVVCSVDTALCRDGVSATRGILVAEALDVVAQLGQCSGGGTTGESAAHDENGIFAAVVGIDELSLALVFGPLLLNRPVWDTGIGHVITFRELDVFHVGRGGRGLVKDTGENRQRNGDEAAADYQREKHGYDVVERAHLARAQTEGLHHALHSVADVHEQAANGDDVGYAAHRVLEAEHDVFIAVGGVAVEGELPEVQQQEAENHHAGDDHGARRERRFQRTFLLVVRTGIVVFVL